MVCVLEVRKCSAKMYPSPTTIIIIISIPLIIAARGNISHNSSGALVALLDQAQQLDPDANPPVVALETAKKYLNSVIET